MAKVVNVYKQPDIVLFYCPGCRWPHKINIDGNKKPVWGWNGSVDKPTFKPSLIVTTRDGDGNVNCICHSYINLGMIQFLTDSTHKLSGQTVEIPEWDKLWRY